MFDYIEFTRILKHGAKDKDDQWYEGDTITASNIFFVLPFPTLPL
jgi:hypothetical protein